jgi:hypothetical protein
MKKSPTEITNESAKFLLSAYRHNGADAQDPIFREALEQAARDPDLASWFANQRNFDTSIVEKLNSIQPPATLRSAILAGIHNGASKHHSPVGALLATAAVLVLSGMLLTVMYMRGDSNHRSLSQYQNAAFAVLSEGSAPNLDLLTSNLSRSQEYLSERSAPRAPELPAALRELHTAGCKAINWNGEMVSLTCFYLPSGKLLHLFVVDAKSLNQAAFQDDIQEINGWHVKFRRENGMLLMFVSKAPMSELTRYI